MNSSIKITELKNRYYLFYFHDGKPKLLKKNSESQLLGSMSRLKHKGIDAYIGIDLLTLWSDTIKVQCLNCRKTKEYCNEKVRSKFQGRGIKALRRHWNQEGLRTA